MCLYIHKECLILVSFFQQVLEVLMRLHIYKLNNPYVLLVLVHLNLPVAILGFEL